MSRIKSSKSARSGLASVKRDWVNSPKSSQEVLIPWEPTQRPTQPTHALTGSEARLRAIQAALAGCRKSPSPPPVSSSTSSKRASPEVEPATAPVKKRARQLPPDWFKDDPLSSSSISRSKSSKSLDSTRPSTLMGSSASTDKKLAAVFLSQEQTKILKLVQDGVSVFYTGSAGMLHNRSSASFVHFRFRCQERANLFFCARSSRNYATDMLRHLTLWQLQHPRVRPYSFTGFSVFV